VQQVCVECRAEVNSERPIKYCSDLCHFNHLVIKNENDCWGWKAGLHNTGYARMKLNKKDSILIHRFSWQIHFGQIPKNLFVLHKCDNRICSNPDHLFLGTKLDNMRDCAKKGRIIRPIISYFTLHPEIIPLGEKHHSAKLTEQDVRDIRNSKERPSTLFKKYKISRTVLWEIRTKKIWKNVV
jgi:hypothetical protein